MPKTLIVAVDGSDTSERAVLVAQTLAQKLGNCDIVVLAACRTDDEHALGGYLDALVERVGADVVRTDLVEAAEPAVAIARAAEHATDPTICMATHGRGRLAAPLLGSVATEVLRAVSAPVVLVGPQCEPAWWLDPPRVVACWCGEPSNPILLPAREMAEGIAGELWIESVFHPLDTHMAENPHGEFEPALELVGPGVKVHVLPLTGEYAAGTIARSARELPATMLAMTTHARTGIARAALGSVTMDVVHHSPCPVLVVGGPR